MKLIGLENRCVVFGEAIAYNFDDSVNEGGIARDDPISPKDSIYLLTVIVREKWSDADDVLARNIGRELDERKD